MSTTKEINTLAGIKERQAEIQREIKLSQKAVVNQLKTTADDAKQFALNDVLLPAVGIAAGAYVLTKVVKYSFRNQSSATTSVPAQKTSPRTPPKPVSAVGRFSSPEDPSGQVAPVTAPVKVETHSVNKSAWAGSLLRLGKLLVPAGKAIFEVIKNERK